jgi:hypothetical protein
MTIPPTPGKKWNFRPYLIGALLGYVFCVAYFGRIFCAGVAWDLAVAAFGAIWVWPFFAAVHAAFQALLGLVLRRLRSGRQDYDWLILNVPVALLIGFAGILARAEPVKAFKHFVANPIPRSVRIVQFSRSQAIGEPMQVGLAFTASERDLQGILASGGYSRPTAATKDVTQDLDPISVQLLSAQTVMGLTIKLDPAQRQHWVSTNDRDRHLVFVSNVPRACFFYAKSPR